MSNAKRKSACLSAESPVHMRNAAADSRESQSVTNETLCVFEEYIESNCQAQPLNA